MLLPSLRYLEGGRGGQGGAVGRQDVRVPAAGRTHSPVGHVDERPAVHGKELLPLHLPHLVREAVQEVVQA